MLDWFKNLKIASKLLLGFTIVSALTAVVGILGLSNMSTINSMLNNLYNQELRGVSFVKEANVDLIYYSRSARNALLAENNRNRKEYIDQMKIYEEELAEGIQKAKNTVTSKKGKDLINQFEGSWKKYKELNDRVSALILNDDSVEALKLARNELRTSGDKIDTILSRLSRLKVSEGEDYYVNSEDVYAEARIFMILIVVGAILAGIGIGIYISRIISKPVNKVYYLASELQKGHVKARADVQSEDEIGKMAQTLDTFADQLDQFAGAMHTIANGDTSVQVPSYDKDDALAPALNSISSTLNDLNKETRKLTEAAKNGELDERGNADKFKGDYRELVEGINNTVNTIVTVIRDSEEVLEHYSRGDLTARLEGNYKGNYKRLQNYVNNLGESLGKLIAEVTKAVEATASASSQISSSSEELAAGAQEQSSQATEVATAVEEMTKTISETANNAVSANKSSKESAEQARTGSDNVKRSKESIERIVSASQRTDEVVTSLSSKSDSIGEIVQVIDEIADQTNLLALNAAIEAARAGEEGRGFAVVADEVRKLAERTTKATKEIEGTIKEIQTEAKEADKSMVDARESVSDGKQSIQDIELSLTQILDSAENVQGQINQVASASEEQSSAAEQISQNIESISSVTQQSAAGTQQIARASEDLNRLTNNLQSLVNNFKVDVSLLQTNSNHGSEYASSRSQTQVAANGSFAAETTYSGNGNH